MEIDEERGDTLWFDAVQKEMTNVYVVFNILKEGEAAPPGHKKILTQFVYDLKMDLHERLISLQVDIKQIH